MIKVSTQGGNPPRSAPMLRFRKGDPIYFEGDDASAWYAVAEGVVRSCRFQSDGQRQIIGFHYPGDVLGIGYETYMDTAEALTDTSLWCVPSQTDETGRAAGHREKALRVALKGTHEAIAILGRRSAPERMAAFLLATAERMGTGDRVELPMCRTDIADFLGVTIHTISRTFSQLCDEGLIALDGPQRCRMIDPAGLQALAGEYR